MKSIKNEVITELLINKSTFINYLIPVTSVEAAQGVLENLKHKYKDASHHCYAYIIGEHQDIQKYSDDGEPAKTAGMPMIEVLKKHDLTDVINVSVRYFGGVKLGAGGLVRAYTKSCAQGVSKAKFTFLQEYHLIEIIIPFDEIGRIEQFIRDGYSLLKTTYDTRVHYQIAIPDNMFLAFKSAITEKTNGNATIKTIKEYRQYI